MLATVAGRTNYRTGTACQKSNSTGHAKRASGLSQLKTGVLYFEPSALAAGFRGAPAASADGSIPKLSYGKALAPYSSWHPDALRRLNKLFPSPEPTGSESRRHDDKTGFCVVFVVSSWFTFGSDTDGTAEK